MLINVCNVFECIRQNVLFSYCLYFIFIFTMYVLVDFLMTFEPEGSKGAEAGK